MEGKGKGLGGLIVICVVLWLIMKGKPVAAKAPEMRSGYKWEVQDLIDAGVIPPPPPELTVLPTTKAAYWTGTGWIMMQRDLYFFKQEEGQ